MINSIFINKFWIMSIFSGFPTRKLEQKYNKLIKETLNMLMQIVITYVQRQKLAPFQDHFKKLHDNLKTMDLNKHSQYKLSKILDPLASHIFLVEEPPNYSRVTNLAASSIKRPSTGEHGLKRERKPSLQFQRKTLQLGVLSTQHQAAYRKQKNDKRYNLSVRSSKCKKAKREEEKEVGLSMTMEELMQNNRLVERKMSLFRKKRLLENSKIHRIQQQSEEVEEQSPNFF